MEKNLNEITMTEELEEGALNFEEPTPEELGEAPAPKAKKASNKLMFFFEIVVCDTALPSLAVLRLFGSTGLTRSIL